MPAHVQDLLIEIDLVRIGLLLHPATGTGRAVRPRTGLLAVAPSIHRRRHPDLLRLERRLVRLQHGLRVPTRLGRVYHEVVVVTSGHDVLRITREDHLELIEDAIVLVRVTQARPQVFVDGDRLDRLPFHVDIPYLHGEVVS